MYQILVVDDEQIVRKGLMESISCDNLGIERIFEADCTRAALELLESVEPDLVITDIKMPGMDGIALIKEIRKKQQKVPIIVVSGYSDFAYLQSAIRYGVNDYILKPIRVLELNSILETAIDQITKSSVPLNQEIVLKETILNRVVSGTIGKQEVKEKLEHLGIWLQRGKYQVAVLQPEGEFTTGVLYQIASGADKELAKLKRGVAFLHPGGDIICVFCRIAESVEQQLFQKKLTALLDEKYGFHCRLRLGEIVDETEELPYSYTTAVKKDFLSGPLVLKQEYSKLTKDVLSYVQKHFMENITLKNLADQFYVNPSYLGFLFKKETGILFNDYVNQCRIAYVSDLLEHTTLKVYEIMEKVGIQDSHYFTRMFKKYKGMTPTEYRNNRGPVL